MVADVPAYVTNPAFVQNGVKVQAGNNWEFSRGAVPTPIVTLPDPEPVRPAVVEPAQPPILSRTPYQAADQVPTHAPVATALFSTQSAVLTGLARQELKQLHKGVKYVVVGHADGAEKNQELLSRQRANAVVAQMKRQGFSVARIKSFGERRALTADRTHGEVNRRVEIIALP